MNMTICRVAALAATLVACTPAPGEAPSFIASFHCCAGSCWCPAQRAFRQHP